MKNRIALFFLLLLVISPTVFSVAQQKNLTLEDCFLKVAQLVPTNLKQSGWIPGTDNYYWVDKIDGIEVLMKENADKAGKTNILSLNELNVLIDKADLESAKAFPKISFTDESHFWFTHSNTFFQYDCIGKKLVQQSTWQADAENNDFHSSGNLAYTMKNELYVSTPGHPDVAVTSGNPDGIENGKAAHRNEFGINKGTFWSPDGNLLAFYRVDETMVTTYPIMDLDSKPARANLIRYPMAGDKSHEATFGVYDVRTKKTTWLKTGEPAEQYLTNITFSPDEKNIYIAVLNRDQNYLKLNQYNSLTGDFVKTLFEEKSEKYVEPKHGLFFIPGKPEEFVWMSQRDGYNHLYHYKTDGTLLGQMTSGNWAVLELLGFDAKGENLFFISTNPSPTERQVWSLNLKSRVVKQISSGQGTHSAQFQEEGKYYIDNYTGSKVTREVKLMDASGKIKRSLLTSPDNVKDYSLGETRLFSIKADDGTDLWCRMILPTNFDASKKYPVIVYVYGGPGIQMVNDSWLGGGGLWMHYAAEQGYIIFTLDNRGSANRGLAFEQTTFRNLGTVEIKDQLKGVDYLKGLPYVDSNRMGVFGWSFGGFMTTSLMLRSPGTFKVGVAGGPVIDWRMYEVMYTERYMDTPQTNPEGYEGANLITKAKNLQGKLLLIHGTSDDVVLWQHSLNFLKSCVDEGVQVDYFVYPGHLHNVLGKDRVHLYKKVMDYLMTNI